MMPLYLSLSKYTVTLIESESNPIKKKERTENFRLDNSINQDNSIK